MVEEADEPHQAILGLIGPGSKTKPAILRELDDYSERELKHALADLIYTGQVEEHPEINGAYIKVDK